MFAGHCVVAPLPRVTRRSAEANPAVEISGRRPEGSSEPKSTTRAPPSPFITTSYEYACEFLLATTSGMPCVHATAVLLQLTPDSATNTEARKWMDTE